MNTSLYVLIDPPFNRLIAGGLLGIAGLSLTLCIRRFMFAYRDAGHLTSAQWLVRAMRCLIVAITASVWSAGFFWNQSWLLIIGLVVIGQELYECAALGTVLRTGRRIEKREKRLESFDV